MAARSADVPYTPYPTQDNSVSGTGSNGVGVRATPDNFGAQVGGALQQTGQQGEQVGDKTLNLAMELGSIYNDTSARNGLVQASTQLGQLEQEYRKNRGLDAANAFKDFQTKTQQLIESTASSMPTNGAQKLFRDQFSREADYSLKNAGAWAADQTYAAQNQSLDAAIGNNVNLMATSGGDPVEMQRLSQQIHDMSIQRAHADGLPIDNAAALSSKNVGMGWAATIATTMKTDPEKAQQLYQMASTGSFSETKQDGTAVKIPYMDAAQQAQTAREMKQISEQQERQTVYDARSYAMSGADYDKDAVIKTMRLNGKSPADINAELTRLSSIQSNFGMASHRYDVQKTLDNNNNLMMQGLPTTPLDPDYIKSVFPKEPGKAQDIIDENNNQHIVSSVVGQFPTQTAQQRQETLQHYKPNLPTNETGGTAPLSVRNNNPGNLRDPSTGQFRVFDTPEAGASAMQADLTTKIKGNSPAMEAKLGKNYSPTLSNLITVYAPPQDKNNTKAYIDSVSKDTGFSPDHVLTTSDIPKLQAAMTKVEAGGSGSGDFVTKQRLYSTLQTAEADYTKRLYSDPSGTLAQVDPLLQNALNDGIKDPSKIGAFIDSSLKRQEAIGVPEAYRSALPTNVATSFANSIMSNPESAPSAINQLAEKTGANWPDVYHSMVTQGGLPSTYQSIAMMGSAPETEKYGTLLARWIGSDDTKGKQTAELIGGTKAESDIKTMVQSDQGVMNFMTSIARSGASKKQSADTMDAINSLAYSEVYYNRMAPADAAQEAIKAFTSRFEFMPNGGARVPTKSFDTVQANAQGLLDNLEKTAIAPPIAELKYHGLPNEVDYFNHTKAAPTWITSPKGDSLLLKDPWGGLVRGKDGKPVSVYFNAPAPIHAEIVSDFEKSGGL